MKTVFQALSLWFLAFAASAHDDHPLNVSLMMGGNDTYTAAEAIGLLQADPALKQVKFRLYSMLDFPGKAAGAVNTKPVDFLVESQYLFISTSVGRRFIDLAGREIKTATDLGGVAYILGETWDPDFPDFGLTKSADIAAYKQAGGAVNLANMVRHALAARLNLSQVPAPAPLPEIAYFNPLTKRDYQDFASYAHDCELCKPGQDWVALVIYRNSALSGRNDTITALTRSIAARGFNPVVTYGVHTNQEIETLLLDENGKSRVAGILLMAGKFDLTPRQTAPLLSRLNVPMLNLISLQTQSLSQYSQSQIGMDIMERSWQVGSTELGGAIAPTVVASKERHYDADLDITYDLDAPIPERVERATERLQRLIALRKTANADKRVALIYYNYPPGKENVGASYLNVLPKSLWAILQRLKAEGYDTGQLPADEQGLFELVQKHGTNVGGYAPGALEALVRGGQTSLLPVDTYRKWFAELPETIRKPMLQFWGEPEKARAMLWHDDKGKAYFVFPSVRVGNVMLNPQPDRMGSVDPDKLYHDAGARQHHHGDKQMHYHDVHLPPHHQYVAYYLWLQHEFQAHAMVHLGTHGTHEWHGGREVGYLNDDPGEIFVGAVPQFYPYIVDNIGEGVQAKRRGMAALISYLTPPLDKAKLNTELLKLTALISDYRLAAQKGPVAAEAILGEVSALAIKLGIAKDMGFDAVQTAAQVDTLEQHLKEVGEAHAPHGLHTFGVAPGQHGRQTTVEAMLSVETNLSPEQRAAKIADYSARLEQSGVAELDALVNGLRGGYIAAGGGNDPIRNPDSLPTGRNLYGFDPSRLPTAATYAEGAKQAEALLADYRQRHNGQYPDKLSFNLWGVESNRHEGMIEAQILRLLGVKPLWDPRGAAAGVEVISQKELGRPRIDVVILPSGMYRDQFGPLMLLLDKAVTAARLADEPGNQIAQNYQKALAALLKRGVPKAQAERLAGVRLFSEPTGSYGNDLNKVIPLSNTWQKEQDLAGVYLNRVGNPFGQGFWGGIDISGKNGQAAHGKQVEAKLGVDLFKLVLKDVKASIHSRSSNTYAALDNDDFYQDLGGAALAVRAVNGRSPEVLVANLANPNHPRHETLEKFIGTEMRTRYLNPQWIEAMMKEGYAGARFVGKVAENLWGWQVTVPEAVGNQKWQELYETYVADRNRLDIKQKFRDAQNMLAYQGMIDRMLTAVNKGYWQADPATKAALEQANRDAIAEAGVACDRDTCSSREVVALAEAQDRKVGEAALKLPAPSLGPQPSKASAGAQAALASASDQTSAGQAAAGSPRSAAAPASASPAAPAKVDGFEMTEQKQERVDEGQSVLDVASAWLLALFAATLMAGVFLKREPV
ncbi:hypothetical protein BJL95_11500 [Methylomonas sp. LWB]|uniref:cobaltochelatase subunit CobN n=1 Tax=Methylomonas sp. LWB TaxID=1905845 RepID=UPI0008DB143E|nr:cobaltochelatase subunit CobN [Methylomonas sp. LWB]OHX36381.1 hypothetical protein BJL95_11500 [Methylomonas sp. LWB]